MDQILKVWVQFLIYSEHISSLCLLLLGHVASQEAFASAGHKHLNVKAASVDIAIVTTWHNVPITWANSWLRYHIGIGFTRIYLFFDNPEHDADVIRKLRNANEFQNILKIVTVDEKYRIRHWTPTGDGPNENSEPEQWLLPAIGIHIRTEHTARQLLNVARAGSFAKSDGMNWLLHIDSDEIFWIPEMRSGIAKEFFSQLDQYKITHATFLNDEIVPRSSNYAFNRMPKDPFHQRLYFKRSMLVLDANQRSHAEEWTSRSRIKLFLGYMCGKSAINVKLWRRNFGEKMPILPQHVTSFAYNVSQPGNISIINEDVNIVQPYISSKVLKVALVSALARILHYVNPDFASMKKKFAARKKFNAEIFDRNLIADDDKKLYAKWERHWVKPEKMPNWEFYNDMWSRVQKDLKTGGNEAYKFYSQAAVAPSDKKQMKKYLESGFVYKNEEIKQFLIKMSKVLNKTIDGNKDQLLNEIANGVRFINGGKASNSNKRTFLLHRCKKKAPHFFCDVQDCCRFTTSPQFTFTKRLIGYKRYEAYQWWRPGLKWPM